MSATVSSKYACSRCCRYKPSGVESQSAKPIDSVSTAAEGSRMRTIIPIPAFRDNYIWAVVNGRFVAVVDPGDAAPVLAWLDANDMRLSAIIATHHHADHVGGIPALRARHDVPVFGPARETIPQRTRALGERDRIVVPAIDLSLNVFDI